jgi:leucyl aminopeptidase
MKAIVWIFSLILASLAARVGPGKRLIKTEFEVFELTDEEVQELVRNDIKFMDITYGAELTRCASLPKPKFPTQLTHHREAAIRSSMSRIDLGIMEKHLKKLTSFRTRYYRSNSGLEAAEWLYRMIKHMTKDSPLKVTTRRIIHKGWPQFSVSCLIESPNKTSDTLSDERVILSAHLDSTSMFGPMFMPAPGADDDGSGVVTQLEVLRLLTESAIKITRPIEFLFFSAEEAGLLGSQSVVRYYQKERISAAVLHIDMDGYTLPNVPAGIGLIKDNTDNRMNRLLRSLVDMYTELSVKETECGYACSDHYSWHIAGYPVAALTEGAFEDKNPHIHTPSDTIQNINFDHMKEFVKVALAYALHMTDPDAPFE